MWLECYGFFSSVIEVVGLKIKEKDVPCDHSGRNYAFSISCQEYAVVLVFRGSS